MVEISQNRALNGSKTQKEIGFSKGPDSHKKNQDLLLVASQFKANRENFRKSSMSMNKSAAVLTQPKVSIQDLS